MNELKTAFFARNFDQVEELLEQEPQSFKALNDFDQRQIVSGLLREKRFDPILQISDTNAVVLDLFELDKLEGSFVETVITSAPFYSQPITRFNAKQLMQENPDAAALEFVKTFVSKIENIDESVGKDSLLKIAINKNLPLQVIELLINAGCKANEIDANENTLLHHNILPEYAQFLITKGADVNQKNRGNISPLENAIENSIISLVKLFLDNGANINKTNSNGETLHHFALAKKINFEMYDLLCEYTYPNFEQLNNDGKTLLYDFIRSIDRYSSASNYDYLKKILDQGASITTICSHYNKPITPLDLALTKPTQVFEIVLEYYNQDINITDNNGNTLLHKLCSINLNFEADKAKELYRKVKLVLEKGADKNIRNSQDKLAYELAIDDNLKEKVVALLLKS